MFWHVCDGKTANAHGAAVRHDLEARESIPTTRLEGVLVDESRVVIAVLVAMCVIELES